MCYHILFIINNKILKKNLTGYINKVEQRFELKYAFFLVTSKTSQHSENRKS